MFVVSLLGRLCSYTDNPLRSGFHVESVFYYTINVKNMHPHRDSNPGTRPLLSGQHHGIYTRSMATFMNF